MNNTGKLTSGTIILLVVAAAAYWLGTHMTSSTKEATNVAKAERKVLYYRDPMGLPGTSQVPKKDAMGMDYVPVYEGDAGSGPQLSISLDKVQKLGVISEAATMRELNRTLRVTGRIEIDERRTYTIAPKFEGWVDQLYVNTTGQAVTKGQPLFDVYSPELVSAQREHTLAVQGLASLKDADDDAKQSMQQLADASMTRLNNWDITVAQSDVPSSTEARPHVTFRAPVSGVVLEKKAVQGMRFMPGEMLYQIADLSSVWVIAEVPEQDIGQLQLGSHTQVIVDAYPNSTFDGKVSFIYPILNSATRTVQVRLDIANQNGLLKPAMFATAQIAVGKGNKVLSVPTSAVIDSGTRQVLLVRLAEGHFEPRSVSLGVRNNNYVEVLDGVAEGEQVVTTANFLIDAESNLKAALGGLDGHTAHGVDKPVFEQRPATGDHSAHTSQAEPKKKSNAAGHKAEGTLNAINSDGTVSITHEPITSLGWPGMTMNFTLANTALANGLQAGTAITFVLVERKPDDWVITKIQAENQQGGH
jgi:Cu(I)/Ag(I) efflux system membrane fusion protein